MDPISTVRRVRRWDTQLHSRHLLGSVLEDVCAYGRAGLSPSRKAWEILHRWSANHIGSSATRELHPIHDR